MNEVLRQRLVGLAVLLLMVFVLSLLLPGQPPVEDSVPATTVSLTGETLTEADAVPPPDDLPADPAFDAPPVDSEVTISALADPPAVDEPSPSPPVGQLKLAPSVDMAAAQQPAAPPAEPRRAAPEILKPSSKLAEAVVGAPPAPGWYVQVGSYSKPGSAQTVVTLLGKIGVQAGITPIKGVKGQALNRVRAGPFGTEAAARATQAKVARNGYPQSRVVHEPSH